MQTPNASNAGGALTATNLPAGHPGGALRWLTINCNGLNYLFPCVQL
jgi:hypothetical protein